MWLPELELVVVVGGAEGMCWLSADVEVADRLAGWWFEPEVVPMQVHSRGPCTAVCPWLPWIDSKNGLDSGLALEDESLG